MTSGPTKDDLDACRRCDLWKRATQGVPGEGPRRAHLMLVGEQPGDEEDRQGKPFVGPAGLLLRRALDDAGIRKDTTVFIVADHGFAAATKLMQPNLLLKKEGLFLNNRAF